jgi:predicted 3-demethylubiquinone-9 3-methyltransferase (glyoxalase superfamily)
MESVTPCLWFDGHGEEAANFYVSLLPDSRIDWVQRSPSDYPGGVQGQALILQFTLAGRPYQALNGGPGHPFTDAVSLSVSTAGQAETDLLWNALIEGGGSPVACGWLKDRFGLSWQIVPKRLPEMLGSPDRAAAKRAMAAMMTMVRIDIAAVERAFAGEEA